MVPIQLKVQAFHRGNRKFGNGIQEGFLKQLVPLYLVIL